MENLPNIEVSFRDQIGVIMNIYFESQFIFVNFAVQLVTYDCL